MYTKYFSIKELPFANTPDPAYLYMSEQHREAFAHLLYGVNADDGLVALVGDVGVGKTLLCRCLMDHIPADTDVVYIENTRLSVCELFETICEKLNTSYPIESNNISCYLDHLYQHLMQQNAGGRKTTLIIDEAQGLSVEALEYLRVLSDMTTSKQRLIRLVLVGQPKLQVLLADPSLCSLAQRVNAYFYLTGLSQADVMAYVKHRLAIAGTTRQLFPDRVLKKVAKMSRGIPRLINILCDRTLLATYAHNRALVNMPLLKASAKEVFGLQSFTYGPKWPFKKLSVAAVLLLVLCGSLFLSYLSMGQFGADDVAQESYKPGAYTPASITTDDTHVVREVPTVIH